MGSVPERWSRLLHLLPAVPWSVQEVEAAVLFCFYDGTEKSPGFKSAQSAREFAHANGFEVIE